MGWFSGFEYNSFNELDIFCLVTSVGFFPFFAKDNLALVSSVRCFPFYGCPLIYTKSDTRVCVTKEKSYIKICTHKCLKWHLHYVFFHAVHTWCISRVDY